MSAKAETAISEDITGMVPDFRRLEGLSVVRTVFRGIPRYIVSERNSGRHLAVSPLAYALLSRIDGKTPLANSLAALKLSPAEGERLLRRLIAAGLVTSSAVVPQSIPSPAGPVEGRYLFLRRELVDLGNAMPAIDQGMGWLFRPVGVALWAVLMVVALLLFVADDGRSDIFAWLRQFDATQALLLYGVFLLLKLLHEFGHAVALWRMAGKEGLPVQSIRAGIAVMLFVPFPFTNVSMAWRLSSKWRRAAVGMAGMYVESWVALLAILLWASVDDPLIRAAAVQVATVAAVTTLIFNLNPFGRMDGYYVLSDLLERPNLMQRAQAAAMAFSARLFRVRPPAELPPLEPALVGYWLGTLAYRVLVFAGLAWLAHGVSPWAALLMVAIAISLIVVRPAINTARWLQVLAADPSATQRRLWIFAASILAFMLLIPLPAGVAAVGVVEAENARFIFPPRDVRILEVAPAGASGPGSLIKLESPDIANAQRTASLRQSEALARWRQAMDSGGAGAQAAAETVSGQQSSTDALNAEAALLTLDSAPGWDPLEAQAYVGAWVAPNPRVPLAVLIPPGRMRLHVMVEESAIDQVRDGTGTARARIAGQPDMAFSAQVSRIAPEAQHQMPSEALGKPAGGPVTIDPKDPAGRRAVNPMTSVWLVPVSNAPLLRHGQRVDVRLGSAPRPLLWQAIMSARRLLDEQAQ